MLYFNLFSGVTTIAMEGARFSPIPNNSNCCCCVYNCTSKACRSPDIRFHTFPRYGKPVNWKNEFGIVVKVDKRSLWIKILKMAKEPSPNMRVCSLHFKDDDYISPRKYISARKRRLLKSTANPSLNLPIVVRDKRESRLTSRETKIKRSVARKPGRKRKQSQDEDNELSEQKRDRSDSELNNSNKDGDVTNRFEFVNIAPIEEVLIKEEPTDEFIEEECVDEPSEEIIRREERIEGPSEEIVIKTERIDEHSEEIVVKEEQTDDYPTDSEVYDNLQLHMKSEVDEEKFQIPDQST